MSGILQLRRLLCGSFNGNPTAEFFNDGFYACWVERWKHVWLKIVLVPCSIGRGTELQALLKESCGKSTRRECVICVKKHYSILLGNLSHSIKIDFVGDSTRWFGKSEAIWLAFHFSLFCLLQWTGEATKVEKIRQGLSNNNQSQRIFGQKHKATYLVSKYTRKYAYKIALHKQDPIEEKDKAFTNIQRRYIAQTLILYVLGYFGGPTSGRPFWCMFLYYQQYH